MSVKPSKPQGKKVRAVLKIGFGGEYVIYRYENLMQAFKAAETLSNAMFRLANGDPEALPLMKGSVLMERIGEEKGKVVTDEIECITSTLRLADISYVAVVCPCCGTQIFDKIKPFNDATEHDTPDSDDDLEPEVDTDDPVPPAKEDGPGYYEGDDWKKGKKP